MAIDRINDLRAFKGFIEERLADMGDDPALDAALLDWQLVNQGDEELLDAVEAIREGLSDVDAGRLTPVRDAIDEVRRKHGLPPL